MMAQCLPPTFERSEPTNKVFFDYCNKGSEGQLIMVIPALQGSSSLRDSPFKVDVSKRDPYVEIGAVTGDRRVNFSTTFPGN
jgi:hypothetical protein